MKRNKLFTSIFFRYVLAFIIIILVSFLTLAIIISAMVKNNLTEAKCNELERVSVSAKNLIEFNYMTSSDTTIADYIGKNAFSVQKNITAITNKDEMFIIITDLDGNILITDSGVSSEIRSERISQSLVDDLKINGKYLDDTDAGIFNESHYVSGVVLYNDTEGQDETRSIGYLITCTPVSLVNKPANSTIRTLVVICVWVMLAAIVAAYFISEKIVRPIKNMSVAARAFASGDFSVRVPEHGNDEIAEFTRVFNNMANDLESMDKMRSVFIANVSHDLRSPMTTISGFIDGILDGAIKPDMYEHYLRIVAGEVHRLSRLVATLLDISRIQAGDRKFNMTSFDICEMGRQILISFEKRIEDKKLDVTFECDDDRIFVNADVDAIYQVFYNLCDNALKFSYDKGRLAVSVREREKSVYVYVYNEGKGIDEEDIPYVFDRFFKGDKSRGEFKSGVGLGLYISKTIMEAHNQTIKVESKKGRYCEFMFSLKKDKPPVQDKRSAELTENRTSGEQSGDESVGGYIQTKKDKV